MTAIPKLDDCGAGLTVAHSGEDQVLRGTPQRLAPGSVFGARTVVGAVLRRSWAVINAVGELDLSAFLAYYRSDGQGRPAYHPKMMTALVLYCYCKGIRTSRAGQMACFDDVGCRVITGNQAIDHATVARFVRRHRDPLTGLFVQVLAICAREGLVTVDLVAGDGTKVKANASKAASRTLEELDVSIAELQKALEAEVTAWWHQADLLDSQDEQAAADADRAVPAATGTRKRTADRLARAGQAREMLAQRHGDTRGASTALEQARQRAVKAAKRLAGETAAHQQKLDRYQESQQAKASGGGGRAGRPPKPMDQAAKVCAARSEQERADAALQRALADPGKGNVPKGNTTDPHCRIMPAKTGGYMCARNLQALANDRQIILAMLLHDNPIDVGALHPLLKAGRANLDAIGITRAIGKALFDAGYASEANSPPAARPACWSPCTTRPHLRPRPGRRQDHPRRLGGHGRHDGHARGQGSLQEAPGHHRARLRAAVRPHGTKPELPRRDGRHRAPPLGHHPQPAEMLPRPATLSIRAGHRPGTLPRTPPDPARTAARPSPPLKGSSRPCQPKP